MYYRRGPDTPWKGAISRGKGYSIVKCRDCRKCSISVGTVHKRLNRSICRFGCGLGWAEGNNVPHGNARWRHMRIQLNRPSAAAMSPFVKLL